MERLQPYLRAAYGRGFAQPVELPLLSVVKTAAGEERVIQVTLRPVRWDARTRAATAVEQVTLNVSWARLAEATGGRRGGPEIDRAALSPAARRAALRSSVYTGPLRLEPTRPWVRLGVLRPGLYVLSAADLATAGIPVAGVDPASFRIFRSTPGDLPESVMVDRDMRNDLSGATQRAFLGRAWGNPRDAMVNKG